MKIIFFIVIVLLIDISLVIAYACLVASSKADDSLRELFDENKSDKDRYGK